MFREISRLFQNPLRLKILKFFVLQPYARASGDSVSSVAGVSQNVAEGELKALVRSGVITARRQGKKTLYTLSLGYPHTDALRTFLEDATWPSEKTMADAFRGISGITLVVATGVLTRDTRTSVDLLIVARRPQDVRIKRAVRKVETAAAFPMRYAVLTVKEYAERRLAHDRLVRDIFEFSHKVITGKP